MWSQSTDRFDPPPCLQIKASDSLTGSCFFFFSFSFFFLMISTRSTYFHLPAFAINTATCTLIETLCSRHTTLLRSDDTSSKINKTKQKHTAGRCDARVGLLNGIQVTRSIFCEFLLLILIDAPCEPGVLKSKQGAGSCEFDCRGAPGWGLGVKWFVFFSELPVLVWQASVRFSLSSE